MEKGNEVKKPCQWMVMHPHIEKTVLCQDRKWRTSPVLFGTLSCCVKFYKKEGFALRTAKQLNANGETKLVPIYSGDSISSNLDVTNIFEEYDKEKIGEVK